MRLKKYFCIVLLGLALGGCRQLGTGSEGVTNTGNGMDNRDGRAGHLDLSFGLLGTGTLVDFLEVSERATAAQALAVDQKKRIVLGAHDQDFGAIIRYLPDGKKDESFGQKGLVKLPVFTLPSSIQVDSRNRYVIAGPEMVMYPDGQYYKDIVILRCLESGALDPTFNSGSPLRIRAGHGSNSEQPVPQIALASADEVAVSFSRNNPGSGGDFAVQKLTEKGAPASGFGTSGLVVVDLGQNKNDFVWSLSLSPSGKIFLGGVIVTYINGFSGNDMAILCLKLADGSRCSDFANNGVLIQDLASDLDFPNKTISYEQIQTVHTQAQGRILVGGYAYLTPTYGSDYFVRSYDEQGAIDRSFGENGTYLLKTPGTQTLYSMLLQSDGKILLHGLDGPTAIHGDVGKDQHLLVVRLKSSGIADPEFGTSGAAFIGFEGIQALYHYGGIALQDGNRFVVTTSLLRANAPNFYDYGYGIARLFY